MAYLNPASLSEHATPPKMEEPASIPAKLMTSISTIALRIPYPK
jgi:hypothetical protein